MAGQPWDRFRTGQGLRGRLLQALVEHAGAGAVLPAGASIGPWEVLELLGSGGMSHVYLARRAEGEFEQRVALKLVRRNAELIDRLRHERQVIAGLRHPHIVSLIDGGETAEGDLWLAMALVEGLPIDAYAAAGRLPWRARLALFDLVCAAVEYAHGRALIHRDIKPANILVDPHGHPRLLDFGIAMEQGSDDGSDRALTPGYASPEQIAGQPLTTATDVFQLGMVLRAVLAVEAAALDCPRAVRGDLERLVARATAFAPEQRYPTVAALREDLANLLARRPLAQDRDSPRRRALRFAERHRLPLAVAAVAVLALAVSLTLAALRLRDERDRALASEQKALANEQRAHSISQFLIDTLAQANPWGRQAGGGSVLDAMDRAAERLDAQLSQSADVRRELRLAIGNVYEMIEEPQRCLALLATPVAMSELTAAEPLQRARLDILASECHVALDERVPAWIRLQAADDALQGLDANEADRLRAWIRIDQSEIRSLDGEVREADRLLREGLALAERSGFREQAFRATRLLGLNLQSNNQTDAAAATLERALALGREVLGPTHRNTLTTAGNLAAALGSQGRWPQAEAILARALADAEAVRLRSGGADVVLAQLRDNLAMLYYQQGRLPECIAQARLASDLYQRSTPETSTQGFNPTWRVAACAYWAGDLATARDYAERALRYARNGAPIGVVNAERMLAALAARAGQLDQARGHLERAERTFRQIEVGNPRVLCALQVTHALVAVQSGDRTAASRHLDSTDACLRNASPVAAWLQRERDQVAALIASGERR